MVNYERWQDRLEHGDVEEQAATVAREDAHARLRAHLEERRQAS